MSKTKDSTVQPPSPTPAAASSPMTNVALASRLSELVKDATPEQLEQLAALGFTIPIGDMAAAIEGRFRWGLRCRHCNGVALFFVGEKFVATDGRTFDRPQSWMPMGQIPWTQSLPADQIDRMNPRCQHCGCMVPTANDGRNFRFDDRGQFGGKQGGVVPVEDYEASSRHSYSREAARLALEKAMPADALAEAAKILGELKLTPDHGRLEKASEVVARIHGGTAVDDLNFIAEKTGLGADPKSWAK